MRYRATVTGLVFALATSLATLACEPPETDGDPGADEAETETAEAESQVPEDGPADIDDGGIDSIPDDPELVEQGEELFSSKGCAGCHQMETDAAGPALKGVTERRTPSWIAKQIMHPGQMQQKDPVNQKLREDFPSPMTPMGIKPDEARALMAYLDAQ